MLMIGERINSSIKRIEDAIKAKDSAFIQQEAVRQVQAGAQVVDLNAGTLIKTESEELVWLIQTVNNAKGIDSSVRIALDSSNPVAIEAGLEELAKLGRAERTIINSVTADSEKLKVILPLVKKYNAQVIGLCMNDEGIPDEPKKRCQLGHEIQKAAEDLGVPRKSVFLDPLVLPVSTDVKKGFQVLESIRLLKEKDSEVMTVIGLSNISYGLPEKGLLNRTFLVMAMAVGLDAAILNPLDSQLMSMIKAAGVLLGHDDFCMNYIKAYRNGELKS
jgi:5-methyltetrahydrofolate--homocysteine methyltransferase